MAAESGRFHYETSCVWRFEIRTWFEGSQIKSTKFLIDRALATRCHFDSFTDYSDLSSRRFGSSYDDFFGTTSREMLEITKMRSNV